MKPENPRFGRFAWLVLAWNIPVILWGALVRVTGSGAGCGNHWPDCNGTFTPSANLATLIEYTHRAMTGIDSFLVVLLVVWAFRAYPRGHRVRLGATLSATFLVTEALVGAALVKFDLVAGNTSPARLYWQSAHLINTLTLLAVLALTAWWGSGRPALGIGGRPGILAAIGLAITMLLGVSGAIAALGDTLYPSRSLAAGLAQDFSASANLFIRLRLWHPAVAIAAVAWLTFYAVSSARRRPELRRAGLILIGLAGLQMAAGITNLLLLAPAWMQILHLFLADLVWISLVLLCAGNLALKKTAAA